MSKSLSELKQELEELESKEFMLQMVDHWSTEDYRYSNELHEQIMLKKEEISKWKN